MTNKTQPTTEQLMALKIGDVVTISKNALSVNPTLVTAPIISVEWPLGRKYQPRIILEGHNPDWCATDPIKFDECFEVGAHMVTEIVERAPYRCRPHTPANHFKERRRHYLENGQPTFLHPRYEQPKGVLRALEYSAERFGDLFRYALASLPYLMDNRELNWQKAFWLWKKAGRPGFIKQYVAKEYGDYQIVYTLVREKVFKAFVRRNWSQLLYNFSEMDQLNEEAADAESRAIDEALDDMNEIMDAHLTSYERFDEPLDYDESLSV